MRTYSVTYTEHDAIYPAPKLVTLIEASKDEVWEKAIALGTVVTIFDMDWGGTVFSSAWEHNHLGLTKAQVNKNWDL